MLKTWRNQFKTKINNRFLSNNRWITLLHSILDVLTINGNIFWKRVRIVFQIKKTKFFFGKQLKLSCYSSSITFESKAIFDFKSIPPCLQWWLSIITETSKIQRRMIIPWLLNENRLLFLNLCQHGPQIGSDIWLIIKK